MSPRTYLFLTRRQRRDIFDAYSPGDLVERLRNHGFTLGDMWDAYPQECANWITRRFESRRRTRNFRESRPDAWPTHQKKWFAFVALGEWHLFWEKMSADSRVPRSAINQLEEEIFRSGPWL